MGARHGRSHRGRWLTDIDNSGKRTLLQHTAPEAPSPDPSPCTSLRVSADPYVYGSMLVLVPRARRGVVAGGACAAGVSWPARMERRRATIGGRRHAVERGGAACDAPPPP